MIVGLTIALKLVVPHLLDFIYVGQLGRVCDCFGVQRDCLRSLCLVDMLKVLTLLHIVPIVVVIGVGGIHHSVGLVIVSALHQVEGCDVVIHLVVLLVVHPHSLVHP